MLSNEYNGNKIPLVFSKDGYVYYNTYNGFIKTDNPKKWGVSNPYSIQNLREYVRRNNIPCSVPNQEYNKDNVVLTCSCGDNFVVEWNNFINKHQYQCCRCGRKKSAINHRKDNLYMDVMSRANLQIIEEYKGCKYSHYFMNKDGYIVKTNLYNIKEGVNPNDTIFDVSNKYSIDNMKHYLSINQPNIELISNEYCGAKEYYKFKCSCGNIFSTTWGYLRSLSDARCPICSNRMSNIEHKVFLWLKENGVEFISQYSFDDCKDVSKLKFDYYLPFYNKMIEVDGEQHFAPIRFGSISQEQAEINFRSNSKRDKIKNDYCLEHGIELLRIPYWQFDNDDYILTLKTFIS